MARLVPIKTCLSLPEALVLSSYLEGHGIMTVLNGYHHASIAWHNLFALQGVQVSVLDVDLGRATDALTQAVSLQHADAIQSSPATAPELAIAAAALVLTGLPLPIWMRRRHSPSPDE